MSVLKPSVLSRSSVSPSGSSASDTASGWDCAL